MYVVQFIMYCHLIKKKLIVEMVVHFNELKQNKVIKNSYHNDFVVSILPSGRLNRRYPENNRK